MPTRYILACQTKCLSVKSLDLSAAESSYVLKWVGSDEVCSLLVFDGSKISNLSLPYIINVQWGVAWAAMHLPVGCLPVEGHLLGLPPCPDLRSQVA